jgi:hypothetical protein
VECAIEPHATNRFRTSSYNCNDLSHGNRAPITVRQSPPVDRTHRARLHCAPNCRNSYDNSSKPPNGDDLASLRTTFRRFVVLRTCPTVNLQCSIRSFSKRRSTSRKATGTPIKVTVHRLTRTRTRPPATCTTQTGAFDSTCNACDEPNSKSNNIWSLTWR